VNAEEIDAATAVARLSASIEAVADVERRSAGLARDRVLAADVIATLDVPGFDNAAMDGYAVRSAEIAAPCVLRVAGRALAGRPYSGVLQSGEAVRIMTGAAVPRGADAVVTQEDVQSIHEQITLLSVPKAGLNVRLRGEHLQAGKLVLPRGRRLRSHDLGLAAAAGAAELTVVRTLRVGVLSTGDELHDPPRALSAAGQYDGNRPLLLAALDRIGYQVTDLGITADRTDALTETLRTAAELRLDAVLSSGGVAQGDADIVRRFPAVQFVPLSFRPGRGIAWGRLLMDDQPVWFFGMPGNSVAAYVMFQLVVAPVLAHLAGTEAEPPLTLQLPLAIDVRTRPGRLDWRRGRFVHRYGTVAVEPLTQQGSSMLRTLSNADALVAIGPQATMQSGELVDVIPLAALP
jgi:molybdopterin molybdotransferase